MAAIPAAYAWLNNEPGPRMLKEALALYGTLETPGTKNNPIIMRWVDETGVSGYTHDSVPWCGLLIAVAAKRAAWPIPEAPLWALNWGKWGKKSPQPMLGDVLTFTRPGGGHVALYVGEDASTYHVLGGNQADSVNIIRVLKTRLKAARRPAWRIAQPANVRVVRLAANGAISTNEG